MGEAGTAPWARKQGQVTRSRNCRHDISLGGAARRNATVLVADLDSDSGGADFDPDADYFWLSIRGAIVALGIDAAFAWDNDGNPLQVNDDSGGTFFTYLPASGIDSKIDVAIAEDTIIVLNRFKIVETESTFSNQESLNFLKNGDEDNATGAPTASGSGPFDTFADLPTSPAEGEIATVLTDFEFDPAGRYAYYSGAVHANAVGYFPEHDNWFRIPKSGQANGRYTASTMPHRIVYDEEAGTITLQQCPWRQRISGKNATNDRQPWVNDTIQTCEFQHGRLFLIGKRVVTSSRHNDFFNLWINNVNAITDSDPVSSNITQSNIGKVLHSAVCGNSIAILCEQAVGEWGSGSAPLTNINGQFHVIAALHALDKQPAVGSATVTFIDKFGDVNQLSYAGTDAGIVHTGILTIHRQRLLDNKTVDRIYQIGDTVFITIEDDDALVNDSFSVQNQTVQSAWGEFGTWEPPIFFDSWNGAIRIITRRADSTPGYSLLSYVHRQVAPPSPMLYQPRLDRMELVSHGAMSYDPDTNRTTIPHTGRDGDIDRTRLVSRIDGKLHHFIRPKAIDVDGNPEFVGDWTETAQYLGFSFESLLTLSKLHPGLTSQAITTKRFTVFHFETSDYTVSVERADGTVFEQQWQAVRADKSIIGTPTLETYQKSFDFSGDPTRMEITLKSDSPGQAVWLGLEYEVLAAGNISR